ERHPEHSLFKELILDVARDIEERFVEQVAVLIDDADRSGALENKDTTAAIMRGGGVDRFVDFVRHLDELDIRVAWQFPVTGVGDELRSRGAHVIGRSAAREGAIAPLGWRLVALAGGGHYAAEADGKREQHGKKSIHTHLPLSFCLSDSGRL